MSLDRCALSPKRILVVSVDPFIRGTIRDYLESAGYVVSAAGTFDEAHSNFFKFRPDAVVLDLYLPSGTAGQLLVRAKAAKPTVPVVVLSGEASTDEASRAVRLGVDQVLVKPVPLKQLQSLVKRLLSGEAITRQSGPGSQKHNSECINPFVGTSSAVRRLREISSRVLPSESPILLQGETGSGKGVLANWIHRNGPRAHQPFLDLNCAGLSRELLESELFGYEKGAFTSADSAKPGLLEVANRGTVFLDEIGDIDLQVQPKLLKVLEERSFRRLGDVRDRSVDIRLISATHRDLLELVREHRFRSDLFFRLNIFYIAVPPLRDRTEDIAPLAQTILRAITQSYRRPDLRISDPAMSELKRYSWPGNIRELRNVLERATMIAEHGVITPEQLNFQESEHKQSVPTGVLHGTLKDMERAYINHVLHVEGGSIERSARRLGIPRSSLYNKMRRFEIPNGTGRFAT